ncbi:uncharacterized protein LOC128503207 isoform X2 [Spea bombifrons]|uniref:uncharacterized protein LOC128503207 isoform X2 n=1 Tax=Spea bombifrons TaxID=233779 RepID=UPI0023495FC7|nr:uncharacterized protein LOC128503207 isoform X2 [Spea bombifrons]
MLDFKSTVTFLLVGCLHLQLCFSAPVDNVKGPQAPPSNTSPVGNNGVKVPPAHPTIVSSNAGNVGSGNMVHVTPGAPGNPVNSSGSVVATGSPKPPVTAISTSHGTSANASNGAAPVIPSAGVTTSPSNTATGSTGSSGSGNNVAVGVLPGVSPRAGNPLNATSPAGGASAVTPPTIGSATAASNHNVPNGEVVSINAGGGNPAVFNPCPDQCPKGIGGNPPCVCLNSVPGVKGPNAGGRF